MNLTWTPELRRFREEVAAFAAASLPPDIRDKVLRHQRLERDDYVRWHLVLADRGWGAPTWPVEHGGTGWNALQRLIFEVECFKAGAPRLLPFGLSMIGPVLMKYGSAAQQAELLPRIIRVQDWWCQGYSEPGSGSDLASLSTRAERDGGEYVVNGQKTWTTLAQYADRMFCLVRTDHGARAQRGISMLLLDMRAPGVSVRPIRTLDGGCDVNEVWLENVRVPAVNLVGKRTRAGPTPVPARPRAYRHRRARALPPRAGHPQAHGVAGDFTGPSAAGRQPHARPHFAHRGRHHGAGDAAAARGRRRRRRAGRRC